MNFLGAVAGWAAGACIGDLLIKKKDERVEKTNVLKKQEENCMRLAQEALRHVRDAKELKNNKTFGDLASFLSWHDEEVKAITILRCLQMVGYENEIIQEIEREMKDLY
mgnify:FL=1